MATLHLVGAKLGPDRGRTSDAVVGDRLWKERTATSGLIVSFTFHFSTSCFHLKRGVRDVIRCVIRGGLVWYRLFSLFGRTRML